MLRSEANSTGGSTGAGSFPVFALGSAGEGLQAATGRGVAGGSKQEMGSAEGRGGDSGGHHGCDGSENLYLKGGNDDN